MRSSLYYEYPDGTRIGLQVGTVFTLPEAVRWLLGVIAESSEPDPTLGVWYCEARR